MVTTRIFCIGDTHDKTAWPRRLDRLDVVLPCGDLTSKSTLSEFRRVVHFLEDLDAPLKLVIPGNHDATLDPEAYYRMAKQLFVDAGITLLSQGTHKFTLENGASLSIYANPYTPSNISTGGFQYRPDDSERYFSDLREHVNIVLTHGPPHGMLDRDYESRLCGCPDLLAAVSRAKPLLHVFGHIHKGWGAVFATWEKERVQIDYDKTWPLR
ncbi:Metallo-dependent phosphatase-like protein [Plectosphaerella plurivora]|uniref:Metallo-dependent phosphatase-like protein n=1 Tax=Plectosphaerella plurivora TaxID=936078 RepID=A0A9P8V4Y4_9PEZI|nr:Metallo-dependent phosphatase-like protein [Plectosphaerella plurivora]